MLAIRDFQIIRAQMDVEWTSVNISYTISVMGICRMDPITCMRMDELIISDNDSLKGKDDDAITGSNSFNRMRLNRLIKMLNAVPELIAAKTISKITFDHLSIKDSYTTIIECLAILRDKFHFNIRALGLINMDTGVELAEYDNVKGLVIDKIISKILVYGIREIHCGRNTISYKWLESALQQRFSKEWRPIFKFQTLLNATSSLINRSTHTNPFGYTSETTYTKDYLVQLIKKLNEVKQNCAYNKRGFNACQSTLCFISCWKYGRWVTNTLCWIDKNVMLIIAKMIHASRLDYDWLDVQDKLELRVNRLEWTKSSHKSK